MTGVLRVMWMWSKWDEGDEGTCIGTLRFIYTPPMTDLLEHCRTH